jgi:hypothetical protein
MVDSIGARTKIGKQSLITLNLDTGEQFFGDDIGQGPGAGELAKQSVAGKNIIYV